MHLNGQLSRNSKNAMRTTMIKSKENRPCVFDYVNSNYYSYVSAKSFYQIKTSKQPTMSKINLFDVAPPQILQVDNKLEEDSFQSRQQLQLNTSNLSNDQSKIVQGELNSLFKDRFQPNLEMSSSQMLKSDKIDSSQVIHVQMTNQSQQSSLNSVIQSKMEQQIRNYFEICQKNISITFNCFETRLASEITHKIKKQIKRGFINISQKSIILDLKSRDEKVNQSDLRKQLQKKKEEAIQKIKEIESERLHLIVSSKKKKSITKLTKRDVLTEEQKQRLAELVKQKRQFEKSIHKKNQQLIQQAKMRKLKDEKQRQIVFMQQNQKKKIKILQNLKLLQLKSKQRQQQLKQSVLRESRVYTHKKYQKLWKQQQKNSEQQQMDILQSIHKKFHLNIQEIKKHDKKYSLDLKKREENKQKQSKVSLSLPKRQKTQFDRIVQQQMKSLRQRNQQQKLKLKQHEFKQKVTEYQSIIDQKYKPKLDTSNSFVIPLQRAYSSISLTKEQRVQIGLQYLAKAKELKKSEQKREKILQNVVPTGYSAYKDYLRQKEPLNYNISKRQFSQIVRRPKQSYEELQIAKYMAQGLEAKVKKNQDNKMYQSMKNKLLLLESLY